MLSKYLLKELGLEKYILGGLLFLGLNFSLTSYSHAQEYSLRDQAEIKYLAQLTLIDYEGFLNLVSNSSVSKSVVKDAIHNAYENPATRFFYSEHIKVEDNILPSAIDSPEKTGSSVKDYIREFDEMYVKSALETVDFYNFQITDLKYRDYLYVRVKYTVDFKGRHKKDAAPYKPVERVAELRAEKRGDTWVTYITSITKFDQAQPLGSKADDIKLNRAIADDGTFTRKLDELVKSQQSQRQRAGSLVNHWKAYDDKRFEEVQLLAEQALDVRDYANARHYYTQALHVKPNNAAVEAKLLKLETTVKQNELLAKKFAAGHYMEAIKEYSKAIAGDANNPDYYYGRGKCYEKLNDTKEAIKDLSAAVKLDNNFVDALSNRAQLYIRTSQPQKAIEDYNQIIKSLYDASIYYPARAKLKIAMGDVKGALDDYTAVIALNPGLAANYFEKGMVQYEQKQHEEAISTFSAAIEKDSLFAQAYYYRGLAHIENENINAAAIDFERARKIGMEKAQLSAMENIASDYFKSGEEAMEKANHKNALAAFIKAVLIAPGDDRAWLRKGDAHYSLNDFENAVQSYTKAAELEKVSLAYYKRGLAYRQIKDEESARNDFKQFVSVGKKLISNIEKQASLATSEKALSKLAEQVADTWYMIGNAQLLAEQYSDAIASLEKGLEINKAHTRALFARGAAYYGLKNYKKAIKDIEKSIQWGIEDGPGVYLLLGDAYKANEQADVSIQIYTYIIDKVNPKYDQAYIHRSLCYKNFRQYQLALQDINVALSINESLKQDLSLMTSKGLMELYESKIQEADLTFDQALSISENDAWALYGKACVLASQNKVEESLDLFRKSFQPKVIEWSAIKDDPIIKTVSQQKAFMDLFQASFSM
ncbi:tetratricopeptide repeat protein [Cesiribacter sp. SM1]|uniref:tetratricopeptide repeat protein n=1 Tax=Cesiribacter sp. SM1 TaxID=2861196 RepID=UPI001CD1AAF6|nr:tetratricopeptide repeat protein [Cesiribacter sp. SM1]